MSRPPIRLLIADDDVFVRNTVSEFAAAAGDIECVGVCGNGAETIEFVETHDVDVVLMDVAMPIMDGVEAARRILQDHGDVKVVMWTSFDNDDAVADAMAFGASGFLVKTCSARTLVNAIRTAHGGMTVLAPEQLRALRSGHRRAADAPELTEREQEVLTALCQGLSNAEIASKLFVSESSVKTHLSAIMGKLDAHTRVKVVLRARDLGLT